MFLGSRIMFMVDTFSYWWVYAFAVIFVGYFGIISGYFGLLQGTVKAKLCKLFLHSVFLDRFGAANILDNYVSLWFVNEKSHMHIHSCILNSYTLFMDLHSPGVAPQ